MILLKWRDMKQDEQVFLIVMVILVVIGVIGGGMFYLSNKSNGNTTSSADQPSSVPTAVPAKGDENVVLTNRTVVMETNYGTLRIKMLDKEAPRTTENFIRLTARKYYDNLIFHRMVQIPGFSIIQGGDPKGNGTGGQSAFGKEFEDEIASKSNPNEIAYPELYFNATKSEIVYRKGYIAMANRGPNTNGSQFFIMLGDTRLDPNYTIFGKIDEADYAVLDKIASEVKPSNASGDGKPNKSIKIVKATLAE
jgi:cyclophilin family peptidyl-prolyl cis-trans isomerase